MSENLGDAGRLEWLLDGWMHGFTPTEKRQLIEEMVSALIVSKDWSYMEGRG